MENKELIDFLPDYNVDQFPEHTYFWALFKTICPKSSAAEFIKQAEKDEWNRRVEESRDVV